jgi:hypothetical protein
VNNKFTKCPKCGSSSVPALPTGDLVYHSRYLDTSQFATETVDIQIFQRRFCPWYFSITRKYGMSAVSFGHKTKAAAIRDAEEYLAPGTVARQVAA